MKRLSYHARLWNINKSVKSLIVRARLNDGSRKAKRRRLSKTTVKILAPVKLLFLDANSRQKLFEFFALVKTTLQSDVRVVIDFKNTKECHPCGTLIFMSHLDIWLLKYHGRLSCTYPEDPVTEELLQHMSVLSRLGLTSRKSIEHERVKYWHYHCGNNADSTTYKDLTKSIREGIVHPDKELFADCLNEAVVNTVGHAYEFSVKHTPPQQMQKWWMFSHYKDEQLFVAIYDQGVGIPKSLKRKPEFLEYFRRRSYNDARLIQAAIGSKMTRTRLPHRGKGLPEMLEFSQNLKYGGLSIWSQNGGVTYNAELEDEKRHQVKESLPGTLVLWSIPFRKEQENAKPHDLRT